MIKVKCFEHLTPKELYEILKLRQSVFIIEQKIIYPDIDGRDFESIHFWIEGQSSSNISSYLRVVIDEINKKLTIGRVLTTPEERGKGVVRLLMQAALDYLQTHYNNWDLSLHAQEYLVDFYKSFGFVETGPAFTYPDEEPVPHVPMGLKGKS